MATATTLSPRTGDILLLVGTVKGAFIFRSDRDRRQFHIAGPYFKGQAVYSAAYLPDKKAPRILVGNKSEHWGATVSWSDDFGASWHEPADGNVKFPAGSGLSLNAVWALEPAPLIGSEVVFAGADPAALYRSDDRGETFHPVESLLNHPERPYWMPGAGGLCLHTILPHPRNAKRIMVGISSAGVYRSDDGGRVVDAPQQGRADGRPGRRMRRTSVRSARTRCVTTRKIPRAFICRIIPASIAAMTAAIRGSISPKDCRRSSALPLVAHPSRADTAYIIPLESDHFRVPLEGAAKVWRTRDAGASWEPLGNGLPQHDAYFSVLRDAFTSDSLDPAGLYFGTRGGQLFASADEGESWRTIADWLPAVLCVRAAVVA